MPNIQVQFIIEILGRPAEHIKDALQKLIQKLDTEPGVSVLEKTIHEPKQVEDGKDVYTAFAELTLEIDKLSNLFYLFFAYMPSHIEIISPETITATKTELSDLANGIIGRLHQYDAIAKKMINDREILLKKLYEVAPNLFKNEIKEEQKEKEKIQKKIEKSKKPLKTKISKKKNKKKK